MAQVEILTGECHSTSLDGDRWVQRLGHQATGIAAGGGLDGGVARTDGKKREGMAQKTAEDKDA